MTKKNETKFDSFVSIFYCRDDVKITRFEILHDFTENQFDVFKRTILSWFVDVEEDDVSIDNEEFNQWANLARSHIEQQTSNLMFFELTNFYDKIFHRFSTSTQLSLQSFINNVLICKTTWKNFMILAQTIMLLDRDRQKARVMIQEHQVQALQQFKIAFKMIKIVKQTYFENESFFHVEN